MKRLIWLFLIGMAFAQADGPGGATNGTVPNKCGRGTNPCTAVNGIIVGHGLPADATVTDSSQVKWDATNHVLTLGGTTCGVSAPCQGITRRVANTADGTGVGGCGAGGTAGAGKQCVFPLGGSGAAQLIDATGGNAEGTMLGDSTTVSGSLKDIGAFTAIPASVAVKGQLISTVSGGSGTVLLFPWWKQGPITSVSGNTAVGVSLSGAATNAKCAHFDASGNLAATSGDCAGGVAVHSQAPAADTITGAQTCPGACTFATTDNTVAGLTTGQSFSLNAFGILTNGSGSPISYKFEFLVTDQHAHTVALPAFFTQSVATGSTNFFWYANTRVICASVSTAIAGGGSFGIQTSGTALGPMTAGLTSAGTLTCGDTLTVSVAEVTNILATSSITLQGLTVGP